MKKSIKNYIVLIIVIMLSINLNAQKSESNISNANKELLKQFKKQEQERINRIELYALNNPDFKKSLSNDNNIIYIYDIVEGKPIYKSTYNLEASRATKTNQLQSGGNLGLNLDGTGMTVGVWDGGPVEASHQEFANSDNTGTRVTVVDTGNVGDEGGTNDSWHGTHVAGTIGAKGIDGTALGMAPNVNIKSYNWSNDEAEMVSAVTSAVNPIIISNHSYGVPVESDGNTLDAWIMGAYTQDAYDIDNIARTNPKYLIVTSAGNSGGTSYTGGLYSGYDKLTTDKNAKNNLVIANANPSVVEQPDSSGNFELSNLVINPGSSQGPTDDIRIKPDIAADGTNLKSSVPLNSYGTSSGTSMASPNTAGTLVLLQEYYNQLNSVYMNSSTLKGLVCHTSIDDINSPGPDPVFGWGFLDAKISAETITDDSNSVAVIEELTLDDGGNYSITFGAQAGDKLKATICWTDMPGDISNGTLNDPTPRLVNDLDLRLSEGGNTYFPWKLDYSASTGFSNSKADNNVDNIEIVEIDAPVTGSYTLTVTHKGTLEGNVGGFFDPQSQDFSLIVTGNNITLGVDEDYLSQSFTVFPNPSKGEFTFNFKMNNNTSNNEVKLNVYDVSGRLVYGNSFVNSSEEFRETINLNSLNSGVYLAQISTGNSILSHKLIIE